MSEPRSLEAAVYDGRAFMPADGNPVRITGDQLRKLFLSADRGGTAASKRITQAGIVIDGGANRLITITTETGNDSGFIDLSYLSGSDGSSLPPLIIKNCLIEKELRLVCSHIAHLSIERCGISRIDADHCQIDNHCRLSYLSPLDPDDDDSIAQIRMVAARIDGTLDLRGSALRAPPVVSQQLGKPRSYANRFALSLASSEIAGRLMLDDGFSAVGGISLYQAQIRNSILLRDTKLESLSPDLPALDAEELRLSGSFTWDRPATNDEDQDTGADWEIAGRLAFSGAEIHGDCILDGCRAAGAGAKSITGGELWHIEGGIDLRTANIQGHLQISGGSRIGRWNEPPSRRVADDIGSGVVGPSLDGWKACFGKGVQIHMGTQMAGPILLNGSRIDHDCFIGCDINLPEPVAALNRIPEAIDLSQASMRGVVRICCDIPGSFDMRRCVVDGTVEILRLRFLCQPLLPGDEANDRKTGHATLLDMGAASITGGLHIGELEISWQTNRLRSIDTLFKRGALLAPISEVTRAIGPCQAHDYVLQDQIRVTVVVTPEGPELLDGSIEQFDRIQSGQPGLSTAQEAQDYLQLFADTVVKELGQVRIDEVGQVETLTNGWLFRDCVRISVAGWSLVDILVDKSRALTMTNKRRLARNDRPAEPLFFRAGAFQIPLNHGPPQAGQKRPAPAPCHCDGTLRAALKSYVSGRTFRPVLIDLRGLKCQVFDDNEAKVWEDLRDSTSERRWWRLLLDGIEFSRFDATDPRYRSKLYVASKNQRTSALAGPGKLASFFERRRDAVFPPPGRQAERRQRMLLSFADDSRVWDWWGLAPLAGDRDFSPQPLEVFARANFMAGERRQGLAIARLRARLYWVRLAVDMQRVTGAARSLALGFLLGLTVSVPIAVLDGIHLRWPGWTSMHDLFLWAPLLFVSPWLMFALAFSSGPQLVRWVGWMFDKFFGFGLMPARAMVTLTACLIVGSGMAIYSNDLRPLSPSRHGVASIAPGPDNELAEQVALQGCNLARNTVIDRVIYAYDVFVPLLDLRQECAFVIDQDAKVLRLMKSLYAVLGWIVVSLTLLTISGVLRRDIES